MDTSLTDDTPVGHPLVIRVLVVAGALFGFTLLAMAMSGAANASEGSPPPPDRPGLLGGVGSTTHDVLKPAERALKPVTGTVHAVTTRVAPVVKPVTTGLAPVVAPVTRPVLRAAEPVLSAVWPVTAPVVHALSPVTSPVLHATAPLTAPVVRAVGAEHLVPAVTGRSDVVQPAKPTPRGDSGAAPVVAASAGPSGPVVIERADSQRQHDGQAVVRPVAGHSGSAEVGVAGPMSGSGGGGMPADLSGVSGAMSAGSGAQHGSEYAVTESGSGMPGTDRTWRAPPGGPPSLHWLVYYGNDHPS
ncbi:hypothetical protein M8542_49450 [Amycolatopsis sp. OK19-0408]|uniref:Uncharacterized protein n=1 Tax=Amycolatopsis iheyensis TaxID=2945988 RepID=A0A9X2SQ31_9PSEU|nr:hypothetical protein [Amycolatopsis iheyensis]MCR6490837.1 hypothetical protein [Amycolatopsis iheyensis]